MGRKKEKEESGLMAPSVGNVPLVHNTDSGMLETPAEVAERERKRKEREDQAEKEADQKEQQARADKKAEEPKVKGPTPDELSAQKFKETMAQHEADQKARVEKREAAEKAQAEREAERKVAQEKREAERQAALEAELEASGTLEIEDAPGPDPEPII